MGKSETTVKEIARLAGVSVGTVSNVINNKQNVDPELRRRVQNVMHSVGYRRNQHARGMILKRSFNVGIIVPSLTDPFFPKFAEAIEVFVEERESNVIITSSRYDSTRERWLCESLLSKQVDGIIIASCSRENIAYLNQLIANNLSLVQLGRYFEEIHSPVVHAANRETAAEATELLFAHGHRRIVHITGNLDSLPDRERYEGFLEAAERLGIRAGVTVEPGMRGMAHDGYEALRRAFRLDPTITAVFADNDVLAMGCLRACFAMGIAVPGDVSIVGVGGVYFNEMLTQQIATFAIDYTAMSRLAVDFLYRSVWGQVNGSSSPLLGMSTGGDARSATTADGALDSSRIASVPSQFVPGETLGPCKVR